MKALEKDRSRRYETVGALAMDIQHYLHHEPVTVGPPGRLYRLRKFVRRHRSGVTIVSLVLLALLATLSAALLGLGQARKERNRAVAAEAAAKASLKRMDIQRVREFFSRDDSANGVALLAWLVRQHPQDRALAEWFFKGMLFLSGLNKKGVGEFIDRNLLMPVKREEIKRLHAESLDSIIDVLRYGDCSPVLKKNPFVR